MPRLLAAALFSLIAHVALSGAALACALPPVKVAPLPQNLDEASDGHSYAALYRADDGALGGIFELDDFRAAFARSTEAA